MHSESGAMLRLMIGCYKLTGCIKQDTDIDLLLLLTLIDTDFYILVKVLLVLITFLC